MKTLARQADATEIIRRLRVVKPETRPRWGRMSAHQMVCHVRDGLDMMIGEIAVSPATGPLQKTLIKWLALHGPLRWPTTVQTRPEVDQEVRGRRPGEFADDVAQLEALLTRVSTDTVGFDRQQHPIFGNMSNAAWLRWAYLHADHHLRQFDA